METTLQSAAQIITKIAPPTGQSAEQFSYTIRVVFCIGFAKAFPKDINFDVLVLDFCKVFAPSNSLHILRLPLPTHAAT